MPNNVPATPPTSPTPVNFKIGTAQYPGDGSLGGTTINVGGNPGDLQNALTGADGGGGALDGSGNHRGNTYMLTLGAVYNSISLPGSAGATGWTRIITAGTLPARGTKIQPSDAGQLGHIREASSNGATVSFGSTFTEGWIFRGLNIESTFLPPLNGSAPISAVFSCTFCTRIIAEQCWVHADPNCIDLAKQVLFRNTTDCQLWDSWIQDGGRVAAGFVGGVSRPSTGESQGVFVDWGSTRIHVEHCEVIGQGENMMLGTQPQFGQSFDITVKRNHFLKNKTRWQTFLNDDKTTPNPNWDGNIWTIKNNFEVKMAQRVLIDGNVMENNWGQISLDGNGNAQSAGQDGTMLLTNGDHDTGPINGGPFLVNDVMVSNNTLTNGYNGFVCQRANGQGLTDCAANQRLWFVNNLLTHIPGNGFFMNWCGDDVAFKHNTCVPMDSGVSGNGVLHTSVKFQWDGTGTRNWPRLTHIGNILVHNLNEGWRDEFRGGDLIQADLDLATVDFCGGTSGHQFLNNAMVGTAMAHVIDGWVSVGSAATVGLNLTDGTLTPTSSLRVANGWPDTQDAGVDFVALQNAQQGVVIVVPPVADFSAVQTPNTLTVQFSDTSTGSPASWLYDFGDGQTSTLPNPTHLYAVPNANPGYTVTLQVTNAQGSNSISHTVLVQPVTPGLFLFQNETQALTSPGPGTTSATITVPIQAVGDLVVIFADADIGSGTLGLLPDSLGNVYTATEPGFAWNHTLPTLDQVRSFYSVATAAGSATCTVQFTGGNSPTLVTLEAYTVRATGGVPITFNGPPVHAVGLNAASPASSGPLAAPQNNNMLVAFHQRVGAQMTLPAGWTSREPLRAFVADNLNQPAGTYAFAPTYSGSQSWAIQVLMFGTGGGTIQPPPTPTLTTVPLTAGQTVLAGTGQANATVNITLNAAILGAHPGVAGDGTWTLTLGTALAPGDTITVTQTNAGGTSGATAPVFVPVPAPVLTNLPLAAGTQTITGTGAAGATVVIFLNAVAQSTTATVLGTGAWTDTLPIMLTAGTSVTAQQTAHSHTGPLSAAAIVQPTTPPPTVTLPLAVGAFRLTGTGVAGATLAVTLTGQAQPTVVVPATGAWVVSFARAVVAGDTVTAQQTANGVPSAVVGPFSVSDQLMGGGIA